MPEFTIDMLNHNRRYATVEIEANRMRLGSDEYEAAGGTWGKERRPATLVKPD